jgi:hypothetical protein
MNRWHLAFVLFLEANVIITSMKVSHKKARFAGSWWLMPVILVTQEAEIRRIAV